MPCNAVAGVSPRPTIDKTIVFPQHQIFRRAQREVVSKPGRFTNKQTNKTKLLAYCEMRGVKNALLDFNLPRVFVCFLERLETMGNEGDVTSWGATRITRGLERLTIKYNVGSNFIQDNEFKVNKFG